MTSSRRPRTRRDLRRRRPLPPGLQANDADGCLALGDLVSKGTVTATQGSDADGMFARSVAGHMPSGLGAGMLTVAEDEGHGTD